MLKYFEEKSTGGGGDVKGIVLEDGVFSIARDGDMVIFREECDGYFFEKFTKEQAIELLQEAIAWIERT